MEENDLANGYQMLEELGSTHCAPIAAATTSADREAGGSFGVVYKAIEKSTGEIVAVKHVSPMKQCFARSQTDKFQGRSRSLRGRHHRYPSRDSSSWLLRQRVCHSIQDSIFARTKAVDSHGISGRWLLSRSGIWTELGLVNLC